MVFASCLRVPIFCGMLLDKPYLSPRLSIPFQIAFPLSFFFNFVFMC